jgi:hypothetical protein
MPKNKIFNDANNQIIKLSLCNTKWGGRSSQNSAIKPRDLLNLLRYERYEKLYNS